MPSGVSPAQFERFTDELYGFYAEAEQVMLSRVARRLARGITEPGWTEKKLAETTAMRQEIEQAIGWLRAGDEQAARAVLDSYKDGSASAEFDLQEILQRQGELPNGQQWVKMGLTGSNRETVNALAAKLTDNLQATKLRILRSTMDQYREATAHAVGAGTATGVRNRVETTQDLLNRFADKGISGFVDNAGRNWDLASYAEMAVRSATGQAAVQGHVQKLEEHGYGLVVVSDSPEECELCRPWERRVLALNQKAAVLEGNVTLLETAIAAGLFHPNCTHRTGAYIPGLTEDASFSEKWPAGKPNPEGYAERQRQREIERAIRKWKRREAVAITPEAKRLASTKVADWQDKMRKFIGETDRRRRSDREQVRVGTPGKVPPRPKPPAAITLQPRLPLEEAKAMPAVPQVGTKLPEWLQRANVLRDQIKQNVDSGSAGNAIDNVLELGKLMRQQVEGELRPNAEQHALVRKTYQEAAANRERIRRNTPGIKDFTNHHSNGKVEILGEETWTPEYRQARETADKAYDLLKKLKDPAQAGQEAYAKVLGEVRPMGHVSGQPWHTGSKKQTKEHVEAVKPFFPQDWLEKGYTATLQGKTVRRGYYDGLNLASDGSRTTTWHEYMHHMERMVPGVTSLEARFHARRTQGEKPAWLGPGYRKDEFAARDKFIAAYMGKVYPDRKYWEVMSMGGESVFFGTRGNLLLDDPEYLDFVLGVLGGV